MRSVEDETPVFSTLAQDRTRFGSDVYDYLRSPENTFRFTPLVEFVRQAYPSKSPSLVDVGCAYAQLADLVPTNVRYVGFDHSPAAIEFCRETHPDISFRCVDLVDIIYGRIPLEQHYDIVVLSGILNYIVNETTRQPVPDTDIIEGVLRHLLAPGGYLAIIIPFAYRDQPEYSFGRQADWKVGMVQEVCEPFGLSRCYVSATALVGLEIRARLQQNVPDWLLLDAETKNSNRRVGHYLAALTMVLTQLRGS